MWRSMCKARGFSVSILHTDRRVRRTCRAGRVSLVVPLGILGVIVVIVVAVALVRTRGTDDASRGGISPQSAVDAADAGLVGRDDARDDVAGSGAPAVTNAAADPERLRDARARLRGVLRESSDLEQQLQAARYSALQSTPDFNERLSRAKALEREVADLIEALPKRVQLQGERDRQRAEQAKVKARLAALEKKMAAARQAHTEAAKQGEQAPVSDDTMRNWLRERAELRQEASRLKGALVAYQKRVKELDIESRRTHPVISAKAAEAVAIRADVKQAVSKAAGIAEILRKRDALSAERERLVKECAELVSRSNRVAASAQ